MSSVATLDQRAFRVRTDVGAADTGTPTWAAAENTGASCAVETTFRLRFSVNNTGTAASTTPTVLRVSKNSGAYTAVTTTSGATLGAQSADASTSADEAALTTANNRLSAGTGTAAAGTYDETGSTAATITNGQYKELEYGLILKTAGAAVGDTFDFRLYNNTTAFTTYTQTPRITCVAEASGSDFQPKTAAVIAYADYNSAGHTDTTATVAVAQNAGDLVVVFYATDNVGSTASDETACASIVDSAGNNYTKAAEWLVGGGGVQGGVAAGIWYCQLSYALTTSTTITASWNSATNRDAIAMAAKSFTLAANKVVTVEATATGTSTAVVGVPSLNPTTANIECLRFRVNGAETNASQDFAIARHTFGWAGFGDNAASSGTAATSIVVGAESRISTGTGDASGPRDQAVAVDQAAVYVAFKARALATGTDLNEKNHAFSSYAHYDASGHSSGSAVTLNTAAAIGDLVVLAYAADNNANVSGGDAEIAIASIADSGGNTWTKAYTAQIGGGGALTGSNAGIYYTLVTSALSVGNTVTVTWNNDADRDAVVISAKVFTVGGGKTVAVEAVNQANGSAVSTPPSLDATTANIECLRVRITGYEGNSAAYPATSGWNNLLPIRAGPTNVTSQSITGEFRISTGTGDASTPGAGITADQASVYVAFKAITAVDTEDDLLANNVISTSSVTQPAAQQEHAPLANDVKSNSSVSQPALVQRRDLLASDVISASSVSTPAAVITAAPIALLANDVLSASSVTNPAVKQLQGLLANDVLSASSVQTGANFKQVHGTLANDVKSNSSVTQPAVKTLHAILANDVKSNSSVLQPSMGSVGNILANDVKSNSSVSQPTAGITRVCLANDVVSASSVSIPAMVQRRDLLANDIVSASSVTQPAAVIGRTLLANDVLSPSSVSQPAAGIQRAILANDVTSASKVGNPIVGIVGIIDARDITSNSSVSQPAVHQLQGLLANNVTSTSSVTQPAALIVGGLLANDVTSASSVSQPVAHQAQALLANDVLSTSSVTIPAAGEITAGQPLANDVISASFVSTPALVVISGEVVPPEIGGGGRLYPRGGYPRKRWEELLRQLEAERQEAHQRADTFRGKEDRAKARKAAGAASKAIARAIAEAEEAAVAAHAAELTRLLEAAASARNLTDYLTAMQEARRAVEEMEDEDETETILMLVA